MVPEPYFGFSLWDAENKYDNGSLFVETGENVTCSQETTQSILYTGCTVDYRYDRFEVQTTLAQNCSRRPQWHRTVAGVNNSTEL